MSKEKYTVHCKVHGTLDKTTNMCNVTTNRPATKKQHLHGGCPYCKAEARKERK